MVFAWEYAGGPSVVSAAAQSPFTNVYADNGKGAAMPASGAYLVEIFDAQTVETASVVHFSVDFRMNEAGGLQRLELGEGPGPKPAVTCFVSDTTFQLSTAGWYLADLVTVTESLSLGTWYNIQLDVDMAGKTCDAQISSLTETVGTGSIALATGWLGTIDSILTDENGPGAAAYDVDNWAVWADPPAVPEPGSLALLATGLIGLLCLGQRKRK